ncbi:hypothetical protein [Acinetobacter larvae]|uniref:Uncharacterized protein n=1 Tax=Acinetobacter larvae TaxID=1789224 RepID=A0A1B2M2I4_9GAMM|nr:hypothetical protein [Acinetobacter larvae]AOA59416.1 hypothetical protein BFG52_14360 [Acinetobacter larvae]
MLDLWFDKTIATLHKFIVFIALIAVIAVLYLRQPLALDSIGLFMATALLYVICRYAKQQFIQRHSPMLLQRLCTWVPIALLLSLIFIKAQAALLILGVQGIAIFVASIAPLSVLYNRLLASH